MSLNLNLEAVDELPLEIMERLRQDPEFVRLREEESRTREYPERGRVMAKRKRHLIQLEKQARIEFRKKYFTESATVDIQKQIEDGECGLHSDIEEERLIPECLQPISAIHFRD